MLTAACGSTSDPSTSDAGTDAATSKDSALDAANDGDGGGPTNACVPSPTVGGACVFGQVSCDRVDMCCAQTVTCDEATQKWKDSGVACLQCEGFACGDKNCEGGQVCLERASGVDGGTASHECVAMPAACARQWSCDCVTKNLGSACTVSPVKACTDTRTHVTVSCMGA